MLIKEEYKSMKNEDLVKIYQNEDGSYSVGETRDAINALIENNMGLIMSVIKKYTINHKTTWDDLVQAGRMAIFLAASRYDTSHKTLFHTFAVSQIKAAVSDEINRSASDYTSNHYASHIKMVKRAISEIQNKKGSDYYPEVREIQDHIKIRDGKVISEITINNCLVGIMQSEHLSLDDDNNRAAIVATDTVSISEQEYRAALKSDIALALSKLPPEEKFAFCMVQGYTDGKLRTFNQVAELMNQSPAFVRRHKKKITAFFVQKYYNKAVDLLKTDSVMKTYRVRDAVFDRSVVNNWNCSFMQDSEACSVAMDICDGIFEGNLPDSQYADELNVGSFHNQ